MASARPPPRPHENDTGFPFRHRGEDIDIDDLLEENARLRKLVVQLSRLVLKNIVDRT
ncbi:MAG: hypothetical protein V4661_02375 [Pseudomonadota bacterium]